MRARLTTERSRYDYTKGSLAWGMARLAVPSCGENITWNVEGIVEIFWVGRLGPAYLAAMALGFMVINFLRGLGLGLRVSGQALVAQRVGAGDAAGASILVGQAVLISLSYSIPVCLLGISLAPGIIALLSSDPTLLVVGPQYLRAGFVALVFIELCLTLVHALRGAGEPAFSLSAMAVSMAVSILVMPALIFGFGPLPGFGVAGAFLAKALGRFAGAATALYFLLSGRSRLRLHFRHLAPRPREMKRFLSVGWPVAGQNLLERGANLVLVSLLSRFGALALAAWGVGNRVASMARLPGFALQSAVRTIVGQNIGAGNPGRALRTARAALLTVVASMAGITLGMFWGAERLVGFFGLSGEAARTGALCLRLLSFGVLFEAGRRTLTGVFQGAAMTKPPMFVEAFSRWGVQLPGAYLASLPLGFGAGGVWGAISGGQIVSGTCLLLWFLRGNWRRRLIRDAAGGSPERDRP